MAPQRVEWLEGDRALALLEGPWDELAARDPMPFSSSDWLLPWVDAFAPQRMVVCAVRQGDELVAACPLVHRPGRALTAPVNDHTPLFAPVWADAVALAALATALLDAAPAALRLAALDADGEPAAALATAAHARGRRLVVEQQHVSPVVAVAGGHEAYQAEVGQRLREYRRRRRKAGREHEVSVHAVTRPADVAARLEAGLQVEASGWKGRSGTAVLSTPATSRFYREVARRFDDRDALRLSWLEIDHRMVAFDLALVHRDRYHLLKTGYDEHLRSLAPGMLLRLAVVERCFELGIVHEFLGPDMPWKRAFANDERRHCAISVFGCGPVASAAHSYRRTVRPALRAAYRAHRGRRG